MSHKSIKLAAAIVNRGAGNRAAAIFHTYNHEILLAVRGHGTASSAVMGLSSKADADRLLRALGREMEFSKPGHGIAFTLSLTGISFAAMDILSRHEDQTGPNSRPAEHKEDIPMTNSHSYELIASVIHTDLSAPVMEAARKAGCQGGTLIKAREIGSDGGKKLFGMTLSQEKAILLILTPTSLRAPILKSICETVMKETGEHAVAISLPVDAVEGLTG